MNLSNSPQVSPQRLSGQDQTCINAVNATSDEKAKLCARNELVDLNTKPTVAQYLLGAAGALQHLRAQEKRFKELLLKYFITDTQYGLLAGFNMDFIKRDLGHRIQEIYIVFAVDISIPSSLVEELGKLSSPYRAVLVMPSFPHLTSRIFKEDGTSFDASQLFMSQGISSVPSNVHTMQDSRIAEIMISRAHGHHHRRHGSDMVATKALCPSVSFDMLGKLQDGASSEAFQHLQAKGTVVVQCHPQASTLTVSFKALHFQGCSCEGSNRYSQSYVRVFVDAGCAFTVVKKPRRMRSCMENLAPEEDLSWEDKFPWSTVYAGFLRTASGVAKEASTAVEKKAYHSAINQDAREGTAWWGFYTNDAHRGGLELPEEKLPTADFIFFQNRKFALTMPESVDVELFSYWSLVQKKGLSWTASSSPPSYSNLCQVVTLQVPIATLNNSNYTAEMDATVDGTTRNSQ